MDRAKIGRAAKARAKCDERDIAKALGGTRYPADTGGLLDVLAEPFGVQVKGGSTVVTEVIRQGMAEAVAGCHGTALTPLLAVVDRRGARNQTYIILRLSDFLDLHGGAVDSNTNGDVE